MVLPGMRTHEGGTRSVGGCFAFGQIWATCILFTVQRVYECLSYIHMSRASGVTRDGSPVPLCGGISATIAFRHSARFEREMIQQGHALTLAAFSAVGIELLLSAFAPVL